MKKRPIEAKTVRRPKAEKKHAKKTSTLNLPSEVEEQVRIHGCENILRAFVAALGSLQNSVSALKSGLADAFDSHSINHSPKYEGANTFSRSRPFRPFSKGLGSFLMKSAFIGWPWHLMISIVAQLIRSSSPSRRVAQKNIMFHGFGVHART